MVKSRFSSLDVRAMVNSIRPEAVGCKLSNVYDINSKVYVLKLARRDYKRFLLLESGVRFHITKYELDKSSIPSNYTMKLRKHIRTRRLTDIQQLGVDRVVDFTFGKGDTAYHLILELFVTGNIILTDHEYKILVLLRAHTDDKGTSVNMKQTYPVGNAMGLSKVPLSEFEAAVDDIIAAAEARRDNQEDQAFEDEDRQAAQKGKAKFRMKKRPDHLGMPLFQILHKLLPWTDPPLCAACTKAILREDGYDEDGFKATVEHVPPSEITGIVKRAAELALEKLRSVSRPSDLGGGHMAVFNPAEVDAAEDIDVDAGEASDAEDGANNAKAEVAEGDESKSDLNAVACDAAPQEALLPGWVLRKRIHVPPAEPRWAGDDFTPLAPDSGGDPEATECFPTFHRCVDEFFVRLEEHRAEEQKAQRAHTVYAKVERIRVDQERRVEALEAEQETSERLASLIEGNVELVERSLSMLNAMLASQLDWGELWREIKRQQRLGHPIAEHIHSLDLERNEMKLLLSPPMDEDDSDHGDTQPDQPMDVVPLNLSLSAHANVASFHAKRKQTREKTSKTLAHAEAAVKQAEKRAQLDLHKFQLKQTIRRVRQVWWFEKFFWFISSENYLVVAGRDAKQNELLFCRHMRPRDVLVQADVEGAISCFVINSGAGEVPPATMREAGTFTLCRSKAWDKKLVISPWSVLLEQVTRGDPPPGVDDFIVVDGFFVRGSRCFLPPIRLEMGFTLLYHMDGKSALKHKGERKSLYAAGGTDQPTNELPDDDAAASECLSANSAAGSEPNADGQGNAGSLDVGKGNGQEAPHGEEPLENTDVPTADDLLVRRAVDHKHQACTEEADVATEAAIDGMGEVDDAEQDRGHGYALKTGQRKGKQPVPESAKSGDVAKPKATVAKCPAQLPRGQKAKLKKIKEKYGDQDAEERDLRLLLLGSKVSKRLEQAVGGAGNPAAAATVADGLADLSTPEAVAPKPAAAEEAGFQEGDATSAPPAAQASAKVKGKAKGKGKHGRDDARSKKPGEAVLQPGCDADESFDQQLEQLDVLTGQPQADDEVLYAFPMVAPYCSLNGPYSFRVKMTPGNTKKGQAAKTCLKMFEHHVDKPSWKQLVRAIPEQDAAALLNGNSRLSAPGMQKLQQQAAKEKKKEKRNDE